MGFGESTVAEELVWFKQCLNDSYSCLGTDVTHISVAKGKAFVSTDRLGGTKKIIPTVESKTTFKASLVFNPSEELRRTSGIQGNYDVLMTVQAADFTQPINKTKDKFVFMGIEARVEDFRLDVILDGDSVVHQIGLRSK